MAARAGLHAYPAGATAQAYRAQITRRRDRLDAGVKTPAQKMQQRFPIERRPISEVEYEVTARLGRARLRRKRLGIQAVIALESIIEAPQAAKAAGKRDVGNRHGGIGQQHFRGQQALGLQQLVRRHAVLVLDHAPQVAIADPHLRRQRGHADLIQRAVLDAASDMPPQVDCVNRPAHYPARSRAGSADKAGNRPVRPPRRCR